MKFLNYTIEELNKQRMVALMPLYLLKLRNDISKGATTTNANQLKELMNNGIIKSIEDNQKLGNITDEDRRVLIGLLAKLYEHLYGNIDLFKQKGVGDMLAEKLILDFEVVEENALVKGIEKGRYKEKIEMAKKMLMDNESIEKIVKWTELSVDDIKILQSQMF